MHDQLGTETDHRPPVPDSALLRQAIDEVGRIFYIIDPDGDLYWWNEEVAAVTGYDHADLAAMDVADLIPAAEHETVMETIREALHDGHAEVDTYLHTATGEHHPYKLTATRLETDDGELVGLVGTGRDITTRQKRNADLAAAESQLAAAFGTETIGTWQISFADETVTGSVEFAELFGLDPVAVREGVSIDTVVAALHPEDRDAVEAALDEAVAACGTFRTTYRTQNGDDTRWVLNSGTVECVDDEPVRALGVATDVTEHKRSERRLERQRDNLQLLNQMLRHDIRNELQLVSGHAEAVADVETAAPAVTEHTAVIRDSAARAVELTKTARDMAESMLRTETDLTGVALDTVIQTELENLHSAYPNADITVPEPVPDVTVAANDLLSSVFHNLLTNAVEHNDRAVPEVTVETTVMDDRVRVYIRDNGPGIPDEHKDRIFGRGETSLDDPGTGIGLYLVETLVEQYGGAVWVEDNEPTGAVFVVELQR